MKRFTWILFAALLFVGCVKENVGDIHNVSHNDKIHLCGDNAAEGRLLVRLQDVDLPLYVEGAELDVEPIVDVDNSNSKLGRWMLVRFDESIDLMTMAEAIAEDENVERIEFDVPIYRVRGQSVPMPAMRPEPTRAMELPFNDPELEYQWHYYNDGWLGDEAQVGADINLLNAWKYTAGDNRVIVAVMDGGIMTNHPDLADNMWVNEAEKNGAPGVDDDGNGYVDDVHGYNFVLNQGEITADDHGTHVAGTIGAVNNNGYAVCGIAGGTGVGDGVRLMSIQIFDGGESCYQHQLVQGFKYAADNGAVIINNSWVYQPGVYESDNDFDSYYGLLRDAIDYFEANASLEGVMDGGVAIFAAGNDEYFESSYPGAYHKYISVAAMSSDYTAAYYTNYGPGCSLTAPGGDINYGTLFCISSTSVDLTWGYEYMQGTSMATPHVSGCAALALSYALKQGYTLTSEELRTLILTSVHDINRYQTGAKSCYDYENNRYYDMPLEPYVGKLGAGYIDAHLLLMQMDATPCLYFSTGQANRLSLDEYFGDGSEDLTYDGCEVSNATREALGITTSPRIENGMLCIECSKPGTGRITVRAIVGGDIVGGGNNIGGMIVEREFELVVRGTVASNGGWL